jgi:hypothetical protein
MWFARHGNLRGNALKLNAAHLRKRLVERIRVGVICFVRVFALPLFGSI